MEKQKAVMYLAIAVLTCLFQYSMQDCNRPTNLDPNMIITPDQPSYGTWYSFTPSCVSGYDYVGPNTIYCNPGTPDYWSPDPSLGVCSIPSVQCARPNITDPDVILSPNKTVYDLHDYVTFTCAGGGALEGDDGGYCTEDGTWDFTSYPYCLAGCDAPDNSNGTGTYGNGEVVVFACDPGYFLEGGGETKQSTCDDGDWDQTVTCNEPEGCLRPNNLWNATFTYGNVDDVPDGSRPIDTKMEMDCGAERTNWGPTYSYCNEAKNWEPDPYLFKCYDRCAKPTFVDGNLILTSDLDGVTTQTYFHHTDTVRFSCPGGIFVDGPWRASCKNGTWSTPIDANRPICRANCTAPVDTVTEGEVFLHGQSYTFQCDPTIPGLVRLGGPRAFCNDGTWKPNLECSLKTEL